MTGSGRSPAGALFVLLLLAALALNPGFVDNVDSRIILRTAERLLDAGTWSLGDVEGTYLASPDYGALGPDGSYQMKFGPGVALLQVPFLAAGRTLLGGTVLDAARAGEAGVAASSALWFALAGVLVFRVARRHVPVRAAVLTALTYSLASYALVYGRSTYLDSVLTVVVLLAYDAALSVRATAGAWRPALLLGAACAAALWIKVAAVVSLAGIPLVLAAGPGGGSSKGFVRAVLRAAPAFALGAGALLLLNHARFGDPFTIGYGTSAKFDHPLGKGLLGLLVGERGGLLFHAPLALGGLFALRWYARRDAGLAAAIAVAAVLSLVLHAVHCSPYGGDAWGPRYLLPTTALLAIPAGAWLSEALEGTNARRAFAAGAIAVSATLQAAPSLVTFQEAYSLRTAHPAHGVPNGILLARILCEKARSRDGTYDLARLGVGAGTWTPPGNQRGLALWPTRVAERAPSWGLAAWCVSGALAIGAAATGTFLRRSLSGGRT